MIASSPCPSARSGERTGEALGLSTRTVALIAITILIADFLLTKVAIILWPA